MARMLQALKNLEVRSALQATRGSTPSGVATPVQTLEPLAPPTPFVDLEEETSVAVETYPPERVRPVRRASPQPAPAALPCLDELIARAASIEEPSADCQWLADAPAWPGSQAQPTPTWNEPVDGSPLDSLAGDGIMSFSFGPPPELAVENELSNVGQRVALVPVEVPWVKSDEVADLLARQPRSATVVRPPCPLEQLVARTLSDRVRSKPLIELAERLSRDTEQTGSKSILLVGIGEQSVTADTLIHVAMLLSRRHKQPLLLIDADGTRRPLTIGLGHAGRHGLGDLLNEGDVGELQAEQTSAANLRFLPFGNAIPEAAAFETRLPDVLNKAVSGFSLTLIDGGRSADSRVTALARLADATYFVVQLGAVETLEAQAALRDFRAAGARVLGCIAT